MKTTRCMRDFVTFRGFYPVYTTMRKVDHQTVIDELDARGYEFDDMWVSDLQKSDVDSLDDYTQSPDDSATALDWLCVEGQTMDGLFEDPQSEYDFTRLLTEFDGLVARMMYYMISTQGTDYTYENLVEDIEELSNEPLYNAPFDSQRAMEARP